MTEPSPLQNTPTHPQEIEFIISEAAARHSERIYGGFIFMAGGSLQFTACLFWDYEVITPMDRIYLGGDVLVRLGHSQALRQASLSLSLSMHIPHTPFHKPVAHHARAFHRHTIPTHPTASCPGAGRRHHLHGLCLDLHHLLRPGERRGLQHRALGRRGHLHHVPVRGD